ncbi:Tyrosine decarboxylase [Quillaja saponaria]|uniref:Tyrosine decarboxylase n=1 Tax=Quillaja saponaria TaxID=32244 RepID=A0AAD7M7G9_QUISA|nr:Tyrosine decarboxylase [Quillaja saponaria]
MAKIFEGLVKLDKRLEVVVSAMTGMLWLMEFTRFAVGATLTEERHVRKAWNIVQGYAYLLYGAFRGVVFSFAYLL